MLICVRVDFAVVTVVEPVETSVPVEVPMSVVEPVETAVLVETTPFTASA